MDARSRKISETKKGKPAPWSVISNRERMIKYPELREKMREKMRERMIVLWRDPIFREKLTLARKGRRPWNYGKSWSDEMKLKISASLKGNPSPWKGKRLPVEMKRKMSIARRGKKLSEETKRKMSERHRGSLHWNWKNGITKLNSDCRNSDMYKEWRQKVFARDNYTCQLPECQAQSGKSVKVEVNHIKKFSSYPELRFKVENGITLCQPCHRFIKGHEQDWEWVFRQIVDNNFVTI